MTSHGPRQGASGVQHLTLTADVYATIAYYLRHTAETDAYLTEQERKSAEVRAENDPMREACEFYAGRGMPVDLECGMTVNAEDIRPYDDYLPWIERTDYEREHPGTHRQWYDNELKLARSSPRTGSSTRGASRWAATICAVVGLAGRERRSAEIRRGLLQRGSASRDGSQPDRFRDR